MVKPKRRDGDESVPLHLIVLEPAEDTPTGSTAPTSGTLSHLDTTKFVAAPRDAALASRGPMLRAIVPVDGDEVELPHDDPVVLAHFVECVYVLHGWGAVEAIADELRQMFLY